LDLGRIFFFFFFPKNNFNSILRVLVATSFLRRGGRISFGVGERKENRMRILQEFSRDGGEEG
jgi:hypothetical protein